MSRLITAEFDTRREAEMTVEHLVQEYGIDRKAVEVVAAESQNSAGTRAAGGDVEDGHGHTDETARPALGGALRVSVTVEETQADQVLGAVSTYGGRLVS